MYLIATISTDKCSRNLHFLNKFTRDRLASVYTYLIPEEPVGPPLRPAFRPFASLSPRARAAFWSGELRLVALRKKEETVPRGKIVEFFDIPVAFTCPLVPSSALCKSHFPTLPAERALQTDGEAPKLRHPLKAGQELARRRGLLSGSP